jgi:hypothetical protein
LVGADNEYIFFIDVDVSKSASGGLALHFDSLLKFGLFDVEEERSLEAGYQQCPPCKFESPTVIRYQ